MGHDGGFHVRRDTRSTDPEHGIHLIEENHHRCSVGRLVAGPGKQVADGLLRLPHIFVQQLGALDVQKVAFAFFTRLFANALGQTIGHGFGHQGFTAPRRSVQQDAFGRDKGMLPKILRIDMRQFDGIPDLGNGVGQSADVTITDIGHLFQDQAVHLALGQEAVNEQGVGIVLHVVPDHDTDIFHGRSPCHQDGLITHGAHQQFLIAEHLVHGCQTTAHQLESAAFDDVQIVV